MYQIPNYFEFHFIINFFRLHVSYVKKSDKRILTEIHTHCWQHKSFYFFIIKQYINNNQNLSADRAATLLMFPYTLEGGLPVKKNDYKN